jgi:hypothetical protein
MDLPTELHRYLPSLKGTLRALGKSEERTTLAKLTTVKKNSESSKEFGLPEQRKYPMPDDQGARIPNGTSGQTEQRRQEKD